ncbi:hypothetical protein AB1Y20_023011 [Prymnesium parvum]
MKLTMRLSLRAAFSAIVVVVLLGLLNQAGLTRSPFRPAAPRLQLPAAVARACSARSPPPGRGVSIVAVSSNRTAALLRVLPTWTAMRGVAELVLLDWASSPPLHAELPAALDPRVRLVRAPLETEWNLARAYNLAIQLARSDVILKLDSDTAVLPDLIERQPLGAREFYRGCSHRSTDENARHLNGVVLLRREHLAAVAGYDERMQSYGYDDTDLYFRLVEQLNLTERCLDFRLMAHSNEAHGERGLTRINHILHKRATSEGLFHPWHASGLRASTWQLAEQPPASGVQCNLQCVSRPPFFEEILQDSEEVLLAHQEALQLYSNRALKWSTVSALYELSDMRVLMQVYHEMLQQKQQYVAVRPMHGLANRLRSYCSADAFARATGRKLLVVWEPDIHSQETPPAPLLSHIATLPPPSLLTAAFTNPPHRHHSTYATFPTSLTKFHQLFEPDDPVLSISMFEPGIFPPELWRRFDQMATERARKRNAVTEDDQGRSLYVISAYTISSNPPVQPELMKSCLRRLRPVAEVRELLLPQGGERDVGVHIRMEVSQERDVPGIESDQREDSNLALMNGARPFREACHYSEFLKHMKAIQNAAPDTTFYLASDSTVAYEAILDAFEPWAVSHLGEAAQRGNCSGMERRNLACQRIALADMLNLASSRRLLLSYWSSWLEVVIGFAPAGTPTQRGCRALGGSDSSGREPSLGKLADGSKPADGGWTGEGGGALPAAGVEAAAGARGPGATDGLGLRWSVETQPEFFTGAGSDHAAGAGHIPRPAAAVARRAGRGAERDPSGRRSSASKDLGGREGGGREGGWNADKPRGSRESGAAEGAGRDAAASDIASEFGKPIAGLTMRKVSSADKLPDRPGDVKVRVHKTKELFLLLPQKVRDMKLIFLVPRKVTLRSLASRVQQMLSLKRTPRFRLSRGDASLPGERLDENKPVGEVYDMSTPMGDGFLHTTLDLK